MHARPFRPWRALIASFLFAATAIVHAQYAGAVAPPDKYRKGFESISQTDARNWLGYLAGPECAGRGSGQPGFQKAAEFMAARFKEFGLKPLGDNGTYFQSMPFSRSRIDDGHSTLTVGDLRLAGGRDIGFGNLSSNTENKGKVVFVHAPSNTSKLEDPTVVDGKIVVLMADQVGTDLERQLFTASPMAVLTVAKEVSPSVWAVRRGPGRATRTGGTQPTVRGTISEKAAVRLAESLGADFNALHTTGASGNATVLQTNAEGTLTALIANEEVMVPNVVAVLEGSDPSLAGQHVGIGAHIDHLGTRNGTIYYGADDDGSGSTALLCVAKAMAGNPVKPRRSIVFMAFCGEEMGLIGSGFYASNPKLPLADMVCELQMDMVGRDSDGAQNGDPNRVDVAADNVNTIRLVGSKRISTELHALILDLNKHVGFTFKYDAEDVYTRSDHYNFAVKGIPISFLFDGFHPDYHKPTDTVDKINFDKLTNAARLYYLVTSEAANRNERFKKDVAGGG